MHQLFEILSLTVDDILVSAWEDMVDNDPGYGLGLNTNQYIITPGAEVTTEADAVIHILWKGTDRWMYFQDGPYFMPDSSGKGPNNPCNLYEW